MSPGEQARTSAALLLAQSREVHPPQVKRISLGLLTYCFGIAQKAFPKVPGLPNYADPEEFIREAARLGASAVQIPFGVCTPEKIRSIRALAERNQVALESTLSLPQSNGENQKFNAEMQTLRELGVTVVRTVVFPGRRYEDLHTYQSYQDALTVARQRLRTAEPVARRFGIQLAVENHKDQRIEDRLKLLKEFESEYFGACVDVGNNLALLEDPVAVCRALAPWALTVHFKDQGVREYQDGFLLADVPLGQGCIDLPTVIRLIREAKPKARFQLELITRDPLKVPVLQNAYWGSLAEVRAPDLARTWALVKERGARQPFTFVSTLPEPERVALERRNIEESFRFAANHLDLNS